MNDKEKLCLRLIEPKHFLCIIERYLLLHPYDILVPCSSHIVKIAEYEGLLGVEANSDNILCILRSIALEVWDFAIIFAEQVLLVVREHND